MAAPSPSKKARTEVDIAPNADADIVIMFHHLHFYVDNVRPTSEYKQIENKMCELANLGSFDPFSGGMRYLEPNALPDRVQEGRDVWCNLMGADAKDPSKHTGHGQDIVEQLIVGLGWRLTAEYDGESTRSVLLSSSDSLGVKVVVSCVRDSVNDAAVLSPTRGVNASNQGEVYDHFNRLHLDRFFGAHSGRQGIAVLGFEVAQGDIDKVLANYSAKHPNLLVDSKIHTYRDSRNVTHGESTQELELGYLKVLEVYAYYKDTKSSTADCGTVIRFVERTGMFAATPSFANPKGVLPGLVDVPAVFDGTSIPAYSDHWVSNVTDREMFLKILNDTLGFTPKVDFNAGVVAAGEARIESTVTGNTSKVLSLTEKDILMNQTQVYLPINNPLSEVGHVHWFIEEVGQGVQHVAARVANLTGFIERVNNYRAITGMGFAFLNIPRSYYGRLVTADLVAAGLGQPDAEAAMAALQQAGLVNSVGIVDLAITDEQIGAAMGDAIKLGEAGLAAIKLGRYSNMYSLLRDNLSETTYLKIVENKILVDVQGGDILYQIFTQTIMQREAGQEAPFLEFIQRVCSECREGDVCKPIRPGCGGFGIRNFLTLFLSIEVSKAMREYDEAAAGSPGADFAQRKIDLFTSQLDDANPILTDISDAMTAEADALEALQTCSGADKARFQKVADENRLKKEGGSERLKVLSAQCAEAMGKLREEAAKAGL